MPRAGKKEGNGHQFMVWRAAGKASQHLRQSGPAGPRDVTAAWHSGPRHRSLTAGAEAQAGACEMRKPSEGWGAQTRNTVPWNFMVTTQLCSRVLSGHQSNEAATTFTRDWCLHRKNPSNIAQRTEQGYATYQDRWEPRAERAPRQTRT